MEKMNENGLRLEKALRDMRKEEKLNRKAAKKAAKEKERTAKIALKEKIRAEKREAKNPSKRDARPMMSREDFSDFMSTIGATEQHSQEIYDKVNQVPKEKSRIFSQTGRDNAIEVEAEELPEL